MQRKVAANLIKGANHVWAQVAFQANGKLLEYHGVCSLPPYHVHEVAANHLTQDSIRHGQFHHPSLINTILNATFLGNRPPAVTQPKSFNPIPLPTTVFAADSPTIKPNIEAYALQNSESGGYIVVCWRHSEPKTNKTKNKQTLAVSLCQLRHGREKT
jgi:hypothetical protein